ncbi:hypothetical protein HPP92_013123 [Vanilla planifolia]|uniref:HSF-type DNA-binding domain-containing protein n=1 Tax=Vanilla planifolia TaxID=51239 RepID=A0A835QX10_VANPL|nr:hypothetical protein HPP92_013123 [Vanilla planifolia]
MEAEKPPVAPILPPFLTKCYDMVDDAATDDTVCWGDGEDSFVIKDQHTFARDLLPKYFKHSNFSSFMRQLSTYGFRKVDHDKWVFKNEGFVKGQKDLLKTISRKKSTNNGPQPPKQNPGKLSSVKTVEVGQFGLEDEIERLKRDKNLLMQELITLRQHQQNTDTELHEVRQRLQGMERNQQQMLSFLAMAVQSPGFLSQLMQQNMNSRWMSNMNKKRRLPALQEGVAVELESSDKQIIMYEPSSSLDSSVPSKNSLPVDDGFDNFCADVDLLTIEENSRDDVEGNTISPSFAAYLEKLMANPEQEDDGQTELVHFDIPDLVFDFDFPLQDAEMESSSMFGSEEGLK